MSLKREMKFYENFKITSQSILNLIHPEPIHIIYDCQERNEYKWIDESTKILRDYNDIIKSTYIRWALAINGLNLGSEKYSDENFKDKAFAISSCRFINSVPNRVNIMAWDGLTASKNHLETVNMIASYAIIDLYSLIEELIFKLYRTYWFYNPLQMLIGKENKAMRILYRDKNKNPEVWNEKWNERLDNWQRRKIYEGISKTFISYFSVSGLEVPSARPEYSVENLSVTLKSISVLRNCLIHGNPIVPKELAEISNIRKVNEFEFREGDKIELGLNHLISIEQFANAFVGTLNISLIERITKK